MDVHEKDEKLLELKNVLNNVYEQRYFRYYNYIFS